jgi:acyl phosphate:glycerol-3-phosphate acyltransferase
MDGTLVCVAGLAGYLIGSVSFTRIVARLAAPNRDISGLEIAVPGTGDSFKVRHMGATTASIALGPKIGCAIGVLDMLKVALPTLAFRVLFPAEPYFLVAATAGAFGHNWPIFNRFKGGRGISSAYGALLVIDPLTALLTALGGSVIGLLAKDFFLTYIAGLLLVIPTLWLRTHDNAHLAYAIIVNALFIVTLLPDLQQYIRIRRSGAVDAEYALQATPMGRGMLKIRSAFKPRKGRAG